MVKESLKLLLSPYLRLSKNFKVCEFFNSDTANCQNIDNVPYTWDKLVDVLKNLSELANFLEVVRAANNNKPIHVNSGFRCKKLNEAVKGSPFSKHMDGKAVDITSEDFDYLVGAVEFLESKKFSYIVYPDRKFIHIQFIH